MMRGIVTCTALALVLGTAGCGAERPLLPEGLGTLVLTGRLTDSESRIAVNQLHGKSVTPGENAVASYAGAAGTATLYVSRYGSVRDAAGALEAMVRGLRNGTHPLGAYHEVRVEDREVHACLGTAQAHYTFADGDRLYWLAADSGIARSVVNALLDSLRALPE